MGIHVFRDNHRVHIILIEFIYVISFDTYCLQLNQLITEDLNLFNTRFVKQNNFCTHAFIIYLTEYSTFKITSIGKKVILNIPAIIIFEILDRWEIHFVCKFFFTLNY